MWVMWSWVLAAAAARCCATQLLDSSVFNSSLAQQAACRSRQHAASACSAGSAALQRKTIEQYYKMPPLFHLDDYERCLSQPSGAYCVGVFDLIPAANKGLFHIMQQFSADPNYFNHTRLHRGFCVSARCASEFCNDSTTLEKQFADCVDNWVYKTYGLRARLAKLDFCETRERPYGRPIDIVDLAFAAFMGLLLLLNIIGTVYDIRWNRKSENLSWLTSWSVTQNFKQLMAEKNDGERQELSELQPIYAIKSITMVLIIILHITMVHFMVYLSNPLHMETITEDFLAFIVLNAAMVVQTFMVVTSFLLSYKLILSAEGGHRTPSLASLPKRILLRIIRITPANAVVVGMGATWMSRLGAGPHWPGIVGAEEARCRRVWWTHLFYVNNIVLVDVSCLLHTWYLAADMQLYVVAVAIALLLLRNSRAVTILSSAIVVSIITNYIIALKWNFKTALFLGKPEIVRAVRSEPSFIWMYSSLWGSLPSSLAGLLLAHIHHDFQINKFKIEHHQWFLMVYQSSLPLIVTWMLSGYWMLDVTSPTGLALYTALERPVFALLVSITIFGSLHKRENQFLRWRGWRVLGKMQLSYFLVHWLLVVLPFAQRKTLTEVSDLNGVSYTLLVVALSHLTAFLVYLLVEAPAQKFLKMALL